MRRPAAFAAVLAGLLWLTGAAAARAEAPMWVVRDADSTIILFGSVHVLPPGDDWAPPALTEALNDADDLWSEIPFDEASDRDAARQMRRRGLLPAGQTLSEQLSPETAERLRRVSGRLGLYAPGLERLRPWMAEVTLSLASDNRAGGRADLGVERQLNATASPRVRRRAFETVAEQVEILAGASEAAQIATLEQTLTDLETDPEGYLRIVEFWRQGDTRRLATETLLPVQQASPEVYERLILRRNTRWAGMIRSRLAGSGQTIMVVGVGHLVGPQGVPALLRQMGLQVEGP